MQPRRKSIFARRFQPHRPAESSGPEVREELPPEETPPEELPPVELPRPDASPTAEERGAGSGRGRRVELSLPDASLVVEDAHVETDPFTDDLPEESTPEPAVFHHRRRRPHVQRAEGRWAVRRGPVLFLLALLAAGAAGFGLHALVTPTSPGSGSATKGSPPPAALPRPEPEGPLPAAAEVETAYMALKAGRFDEARERFLTLAAGNLAPEPRAALGRAAAWCDVVAGNPERAAQALESPSRRGARAADDYFLLGVAHLQQGNSAKAQEVLAQAAALDPTRAETLFLWGDALRREGKPRESLEKLRAAIRRNQMETNANFYQLKLWLSQLQAGDPEATEASTAIDASLRTFGPTSGALLATAARSLSAGRLAEAADFLRRARPVTDPVMWTVIMQDPTFSQEAWRPELAGFFARPESGQ